MQAWVHGACSCTMLPAHRAHMWHVCLATNLYNRAAFQHNMEGLSLAHPLYRHTHKSMTSVLGNLLHAHIDGHDAKWSLRLSHLLCTHTWNADEAT
jgi:hypothetical protein